MQTPFLPHMLESIKAVEASRAERFETEPRRMDADEKTALLQEFHPDYGDNGFDTIKIGANTGEKAPKELVELLHSKSKISDVNINLDNIEFDVDVLIIGGGAAGASAAIEAHNAGQNVMIVTKLRMGDSNSMMAEGGIQAADKENDSPMQHYLDSFGGGHYKNKPELLRRLVMDGPKSIKWLNELGVMFDKHEDGTMWTFPGGGLSRKRLHACADYTGAEITRVLKDEVQNLGIEIAEFTAALELILDEEGKVAGAVLVNMLTGEYLVARAKTVIMATGGAGRMHYHGFPTTNHYGATADGLVMAYRAGCNLLYQDTIQYHPSGAAFPSQLFGALVTEKVRSIGAQLLNIDGEAFVHPLETRDVAASAIIRECGVREKGIATGQGNGVWLDTPLIEMIHGEGKIESAIPGMLRMFLNYGMDLRKTPILVYPSFHYQNGGVEIENDGNTKHIPNLFIAGEAAGGIHGRNRLLGNSMLDVIVFGRLTGQKAAQMAKSTTTGKLFLNHIKTYEGKINEAGVDTGKLSPILLPKYTRDVNEARVV
ncbi:MAG: FAD-dependent oxidoreductase [Defluviitaleaceae bacterium]|nr:FAD-dependent oxidoreductase [Defluviitaleaceae bacterium]